MNFIDDIIERFFGKPEKSYIIQCRIQGNTANFYDQLRKEGLTQPEIVKCALALLGSYYDHRKQGRKCTFTSETEPPHEVNLGKYDVYFTEPDF